MAKKIYSTPAVVTKTIGSGSSKFKIKIATSNLVINENADQIINEVQNILFDELCGQEIINISRTDSISGIDVSYDPILDIPNILDQYNPKTLIALQGNDSLYFNQFTLSLPQYLPNYGNGANGATVYVNTTYGDTNAGSLVINLVNVINQENVEIEFFIPNTVSDIIYT
jgi:hypothetical protein